MHRGIINLLISSYRFTQPAATPHFNAFSMYRTSKRTTEVKQVYGRLCKTNKRTIRHVYARTCFQTLKTLILGLDFVVISKRKDIYRKCRKVFRESGLVQPTSFILVH